MIKRNALLAFSAILAVSVAAGYAQEDYLPLEEAEAQQEAELIKKAEEAAKKSEGPSNKKENAAPAAANEPETVLEIKTIFPQEPPPAKKQELAPVQAAAPVRKTKPAAAKVSAASGPAQLEWYFIAAKGADKDEDIQEIMLPQLEDWLARNPEHPNSGDAQLLKAELHFKLGDPKSAIMDLLRHFHEYPQTESSPAAKKLFQELLDKKTDKKLKPGLAALADAVENGDAGARLYSLLSRVPAQAGAFLYAPIVAEHRVFFNRFPARLDNDVLRLSLAELQLNIKEYLQASLAYEKLIELHPASPLVPKAKLFLGVVLADNLKQYDKALTVFQDIAASFPGTDQAWAAYSRLPELAEKQKKYQLAVDVYETIIALYPARAEAYAAFLSEARVLREELSKPAEAVTVLNRLADKYPGEKAIEAIFLAAEIARKDLKDPALEIKNYDRIVSAYPADPRAPEALFAAAEVYEKEKNMQNAREYYIKVNDMYGNNPLAKKALKRMVAISGK